METKELVVPRAFDFAVKIIQSSNKLPNTAAVRVIVNQLIRSATSIGANLEEAQAASSRKDFGQKHYIALREARESHYWLRMLAAAFPEMAPKLQLLLKESLEIQLILGAIVHTVRTKPSK